MKLRRTACAGVLLELDGKRFLLDGVGQALAPYQATPMDIRQQLMENPPDAVLLTHKHPDHYDGSFLSWFRENASGPILGPGDIPLAKQGAERVGPVEITPVASRHIGRSDGSAHRSFLLQGSQCLWFLGDSSPQQWRSRLALPRPDVLIAPYAYAIGSSWKLTKSLGARAIVLLHLPEREKDSCGLWEAVEATTQGDPTLYIPALGQEINL